MAVISDHRTLMSRILSDPGNPEGGALGRPRRVSACEGGFSLRAVTGSSMLATTSLLAAFGRNDSSHICADLSPGTRWRWAGENVTLTELDVGAPEVQ